MYHARTPHTRCDTRVIRNEPRTYIAELYTIWIAQLVERSYVKREARGSTPDSCLYVSAISSLAFLQQYVFEVNDSINFKSDYLENYSQIKK